MVARAVPVLAEASVLFAGIGAMPPRRFFALTALANAGLSVVYAGAWALSGPSFLLAFAVSLVLPGLALAVSGRWRPRGETTPSRTSPRHA